MPSSLPRRATLDTTLSWWRAEAGHFILADGRGRRSVAERLDASRYSHYEPRVLNYYESQRARQYITVKLSPASPKQHPPPSILQSHFDPRTLHGIISVVITRGSPTCTAQPQKQALPQAP
ncbi:hypothetical protein E2C01_028849 [Portunus trituberculatus]|uniref:Uncharacterized protein n=1 Tax=Portunus trituberculatus TaxID=210409 RepID=A0A5B7EQ80_PORTR|nr:hypothetical protein [Portunus trituberculatus]